VDEGEEKIFDEEVDGEVEEVMVVCF